MSSDPLLDKKTEKKVFYEEKYSHVSVAPSPYFKKQFQYLLDNHSKIDASRLSILDLGGGTGEYSIILQNLGHDVTLFDYSEIAIKKAQSLGVKKTICADFNTFDFKDTTYDLIFAKGFSLLNTDKQPDFNSVFQKITSVCNENGMFIYWGRSDFSGKYSTSGWYNIKKSELDHYFDKTSCLPIFRYQAYFPRIINNAISKTLMAVNLKRPFTIIGVHQRRVND